MTAFPPFLSPHQDPSMEGPKKLGQGQHVIPPSCTMSGDLSGSQFRGTMRALAFYTLGAGGQVYRMLLFFIEIYSTYNIVYG